MNLPAPRAIPPFSVAWRHFPWRRPQDLLTPPGALRDLLQQHLMKPRSLSARLGRPGLARLARSYAMELLINCMLVQAFF